MYECDWMLLVSWLPTRWYINETKILNMNETADSWSADASTTWVLCLNYCNTPHWLESVNIQIYENIIKHNSQSVASILQIYLFLIFVDFKTLVNLFFVCNYEQLYLGTQLSTSAVLKNIRTIRVTFILFYSNKIKVAFNYIGLHPTIMSTLQMKVVQIPSNLQ